jgi:hypothetical protein
METGNKHGVNPDGTWKPGYCPNPKGRPSKGYSIAERMREMFASDPEKKDAIITSMITKAMEGDVQAAKYLSSYIDGMPVQKVEQKNINALVEEIENATNGFDE